MKLALVKLAGDPLAGEPAVKQDRQDKENDEHDLRDGFPVRLQADRELHPNNRRQRPERRENGVSQLAQDKARLETQSPERPGHERQPDRSRRDEQYVGDRGRGAIGDRHQAPHAREPGEPKGDREEGRRDATHGPHIRVV